MKKRILDLEFGDVVCIEGVTGEFVGWMDKGVYCHLRRTDNGQIWSINVDGFETREVEVQMEIRTVQRLRQSLHENGEAGLYDVVLCWENQVSNHKSIELEEVIDKVLQCMGSSSVVCEGEPFTFIVRASS